MRYKRALVTGGAGCIGSHLSDALIRRRIKTYVIDDLSLGRRDNLNPNATFFRLSVESPKVSALIEKLKPDVVFHMAAQIDVRVSVREPIRDARVNVIGGLRVLEGCVRAKAKRLVFSSSGGAIYHGLKVIPTPENVPSLPRSPYGVSKLAFELYLHSVCHTHGLPYVALRYANVYGPRQGARGEAGVVSVFARQMLAGKTPVVYGDGKQSRDFVYVDDVVRANLLAMKPSAHGVFNIATGRETSVNGIVRLLRRETGYRGKIGSGPEVRGEERRSVLDASLAKRVLGWEPAVGLEEGLAKTVAWMRTHLKSQA
ncbi:NAD-dependent epimerase/dehydratase family protein [Patescibacteria group bacterium]|nr:MAG: NAD-dependent epimerase/dehydratase family protein [Patescibacteria group bacterium]